MDCKQLPVGSLGRFGSFIDLGDDGPLKWALIQNKFAQQSCDKW